MRYSKQLFFITLLLCIVGILMVFEASATESLDTFGNKYTLAIQQLRWLGLGWFGLLIISRIPTQFWKQISPVFYFAGLIGLICIFIPHLGVEVNGAHRWVSIAGFRFQPVEIMKFGVLLYFAKWLEHHQRIGPFLTLTLIPVTLVMLQPDLGSTLIVLSIAFGLFVFADAPIKPLIGIAVAGIIGVALLIFSSPYRLERIQTYLNPELDPLDTGYHVRQITFALGNGGLFGTGLGQSKQKYRYIPELSTDSIFAIVAEELGFVGSLFLIGLFMYFFRTAFQVMQQSKNKRFEFLLASGITVWITSQTILNLAAVVALAPLTGIPLPFISRGGTSLVVLLVAVGILIRVSIENEKANQKQTFTHRISRSHQRKR